MQIIWDTMITSFGQVKEAGSYLLFYLLALIFGLAVWSSKAKDNRILKETGDETQLWPFLFSGLALILVAANPLCIWVMNKITPIQGQYEKIWSLLMVPFLVAYAVVCFYELLTEQKQRNILLLGMVALIGLAGSSYGLMSERQSDGAYEKEREAVGVVYEAISEAEYLSGKPVLAAQEIVEYSAMYTPDLSLLYGKDLYTQGLDLGIMDSYLPELMGVYEAMKDPRENLVHLAEMALIYDCGIVVVDRFEKAPEKAGSFVLYDETKDYLIYQLTNG